MIFKIIGGKAVRYDSGGIDKIDDSTVDFSQAESRENIAPTDTMKIILGKIMKWFSDLSAGAASSLLGQNLTAGKVLVSDDGGKVAASVVDASKVGFLSGVTGDLQEQINSLNSAQNIFFTYITSYSIFEDLFEKLKVNNMGIAYIGSPVMSILTNGKATNNSKGLIMKMGANQIDYMLQGGVAGDRKSVV